MTKLTTPVRGTPRASAEVESSTAFGFAVFEAKSVSRRGTLPRIGDPPFGGRTAPRALDRRVLPPFEGYTARFMHDPRSGAATSVGAAAGMRRPPARERMPPRA